VGQVGGTGTFVREGRIGPFQALHPVFGIGKGGYYLFVTIPAGGIAAAVVHVQVGVDNDMNVLRHHPQTG